MKMINTREYSVYYDMKVHGNKCHNDRNNEIVHRPVITKA
jgi:hypothetical protein